MKRADAEQKERPHDHHVVDRIRAVGDMLSSYQDANEPDRNDDAEGGKAADTELEDCGAGGISDDKQERNGREPARQQQEHERCSANQGKSDCVHS
jgi:hypothetical protein